MEMEKAIALYAGMLKTDAPDEALKDELVKHLDDIAQEVGAEKPPSTATRGRSSTTCGRTWTTPA